MEQRRERSFSGVGCSLPRRTDPQRAGVGGWCNCILSHSLFSTSAQSPFGASACDLSLLCVFSSLHLTKFLIPSLKKKCLFLAALGLYCCVGFSLVMASMGYPVVVVHT